MESGVRTIASEGGQAQRRALTITPAKPHRRVLARKPARTLGAPHPSAARPRERSPRCVLPIGCAALGCGAPGGRKYDKGLISFDRTRSGTGAWRAVQPEVPTRSVGFAATPRRG